MSARQYCEDYPACGHTPIDPCWREWYDEPDAFNPQVNPHCFCDHEAGVCDVEPEEPWWTDEQFTCPTHGEDLWAEDEANGKLTLECGCKIATPKEVS